MPALAMIGKNSLKRGAALGVFALAIACSGTPASSGAPATAAPVPAVQGAATSTAAQPAQSNQSPAEPDPKKVDAMMKGVLAKLGRRAAPPGTWSGWIWVLQTAAGTTRAPQAPPSSEETTTQVRHEVLMVFVGQAFAADVSYKLISHQKLYHDYDQHVVQGAVDQSTIASAPSDSGYVRVTTYPDGTYDLSYSVAPIKGHWTKTETSHLTCKANSFGCKPSQSKNDEEADLEGFGHMPGDVQGTIPKATPNVLEGLLTDKYAFSDDVTGLRRMSWRVSR